MTTPPPKKPPSDARAAREIPPGTSGWPILGETLRFLEDEFHFVTDRVSEHGSVFRSSLLGRDTVVIAGPEATEAFNDEARVLRADSMPPHVEQFFGGKSLPLLDGPAHRARKQQVMAAFGRRALESYVPTMQARVEATLSAWTREPEVAATEALKRLALEVIGATMASLEPGPDLETVLESFLVLSKGFAALPIPLPGTAFKKAIAARDRILDVLRRAVAEHRARTFDDGLARVLAAKAEDGSSIGDEGAVLELHHFNIAGYLVFTHFATTLAELARAPGLLDELRAEVDARAPSGPITLTALAEMPALDRFVKEVKRFTPFVPVFFGRAARDFELAGRRVPEGWMVLWAHHASLFAKGVYADPERFDPSRFGAGRAEDEKQPGAYAPQGHGPIGKSHKCAGYDFATVFMQVFAVVLARGFDWSLPVQDLALDYGIVPPEHKSGLRVTLRAR